MNWLTGMHKMRLLILGLISILALNACATDKKNTQDGLLAPPISFVIDTENISDINQYLLDSYGKTLVAFDIDDTLLTSDTFFGSDYWYEWQKHLKPGDPSLVPCKFDVIAMNYEAGTQKTTESNSVSIFNSIVAEKIIITSRNPYYRGAAVRELKKAGYILPKQIGAEPEGVMYKWKENDSSKVVEMSYYDGVFMVSGQNKGLALLSLLKRTGATYDHVVLVDDGQKNIDEMKAAIKSAGIAYHGLHYVRIKKPDTLDATLVEEARTSWLTMRGFLEATFPNRLREMEAGVCFY